MTPAVPPTKHHTECPLCASAWRELDRNFATLPDAPEFREHALAAVGSWWLTQSLARFDGDPRPALIALENLFAEHGLTLALTCVEADA